MVVVKDARTRLGFDALVLPVAPPWLADLGAYAKAQNDRLTTLNSSGERVRALFASYRPHRAQIALHKARRKRFVAVCAGRRSGKTWAIGHEFIARIFLDLANRPRRAWYDPPHLGKRHLGAEVQPSLRYWCVAPTYRLGMLQQAVIFAVLGGLDSDLIIDWDSSKGRLWLVGGALIEFRSADKSKLLVGESLDGLWVDEAARLKADAWSDNLFANLSDREGWALLSTTPLGFNWFYDEVWAKTQYGREPGQRDPDFYGAHFTTADNTAVPALVREAERARQRLPGPIYRRNYEASFDAFDGQVFEMFDDEIHVTTEVPWANIVRRVAGVDWGLGNPGAQVELGLDDRGGWWAYREDYAAGLPITPPTMAPHADCWMGRFRAAEARGVSRWWADPSGADRILTATNEGLAFAPAVNDVGLGLMMLGALLHPHTPAPGQKPTVGLRVHRGCKNLIRELQSYRWAKGGEHPVKEADHSVDALRYGVVSENVKGGSPSPLILDFSIFDAA